MAKQRKELAFVFPGQGSQAIGMLKEMAASSHLVQQTFEEASAVLGFDLWDLCQNGPIEKLNLTEHTQPALLAAGVAAWRVFQKQNDEIPKLCAGHSLGEYTALVCTNAIQFNDAIKLVQYRGQCMQQASPEGVGAMAAILGLDDAKIQEACELVAAKNKGIVAPANFNSIGQTVIAGEKQLVLDAMEECKNRGAKRALLLPVSVPSHCKLMQPAADKMAAMLASTKIQSPMIPVVHNVDVVMHSHPDDIREALVEQIVKPVQWVKTIQFLGEDGIKEIIECGPGKVLTGLIKRIDGTINVHCFE